MNYRKKNDNNGEKSDRIISQDQVNRFGERLRIAMNGESNNSFAKKCGWSEKVIRNYLNGESYPAIDRLAVIANISGYSVEWLVTGEKNNLISDNMTKLSVQMSEGLNELFVYLKRLNSEDLEQLLQQIADNGVKSLIVKEKNNHAKAIADLILSLNVNDQREILSLIQAKKLGTIIESTKNRRTGT